MMTDPKIIPLKGKVYTSPGRQKWVKWEYVFGAVEGFKKEHMVFCRGCCTVTNPKCVACPKCKSKDLIKIYAEKTFDKWFGK
jgi:hypothetical protein